MGGQAPEKASKHPTLRLSASVMWLADRGKVNSDVPESISAPPWCQCITQHVGSSMFHFFPLFIPLWFKVLECFGSLLLTF